MTRAKLADVLKALRADIEEAQIAALNEDLVFKIGEIEVELNAELEISGDGTVKTGVNWWFVGKAEVEATAGVARTTSQTLRFKLTPMTKEEAKAHKNGYFAAGDKPARMQ